MQNPASFHFCDGTFTQHRVPCKLNFYSSVDNWFDALPVTLKGCGMQLSVTQIGIQDFEAVATLLRTLTFDSRIFSFNHAGEIVTEFTKNGGENAGDENNEVVLRYYDEYLTQARFPTPEEAAASPGLPFSFPVPFSRYHQIGDTKMFRRNTCMSDHSDFWRMSDPAYTQDVNAAEWVKTEHMNSVRLHQPATIRSDRSSATIQGCCTRLIPQPILEQDECCDIKLVLGSDEVQYVKGTNGYHSVLGVLTWWRKVPAAEPAADQVP